jgi:hypothetical protein
MFAVCVQVAKIQQHYHRWTAMPTKRFFDGAQKELGSIPISNPPEIESGGIFTKVWLKVSGVWKETTVYIKNSGIWKTATTYINITNIWK